MLEFRIAAETMITTRCLVFLGWTWLLPSFRKRSDIFQTSSPLQLKAMVTPHHRALLFFSVTGTDPRSSSCVPSSRVLLKFWLSRWNPASLPGELYELPHLHTGGAAPGQTAHCSIGLRFHRCTSCPSLEAGTPSEWDSRRMHPFPGWGHKVALLGVPVLTTTPNTNTHRAQLSPKPVRIQRRGKTPSFQQSLPWKLCSCSCVTVQKPHCSSGLNASFAGFHSCWKNKPLLKAWDLSKFALVKQRRCPS